MPTRHAEQVEVEEFFGDFPDSRPLYDAVLGLAESVGDVEPLITTSQIALTRPDTLGRDKAFAWAWVPDRYLSGGHAPLVLSVALKRRDESPRWKEVVEPSPGRFMHHLEVHADSDLDDEVRRWLEEAWASAT